MALVCDTLGMESPSGTRSTQAQPWLGAGEHQSLREPQPSPCSYCRFASVSSLRFRKHG